MNNLSKPKIKDDNLDEPKAEVKKPQKSLTTK